MLFSFYADMTMSIIKLFSPSVDQQGVSTRVKMAIERGGFHPGTGLAINKI